MGEIARGSWGLCKTDPDDVLGRYRVGELWRKMYPRLIFAPRNAMSESYDGQIPEEEDRRRNLRRMAIFHEILHRNLGNAGRVRGRAIDAEAIEAAGAQAEAAPRAVPQDVDVLLSDSSPSSPSSDDDDADSDAMGEVAGPQPMEVADDDGNEAQ
eukprot:gnl/MRDRNA2_/MRDRNA2_26618_c0_seq2.p1 gnl/MRDRNA2_/MRDRNA2_26618_c0~~gnl/MRDRNA2_/MRDRNA2_26618_c0_seq2.p1  ORF type:complete len:155 (-),score=35.21 gnl/MRDRNA2_/MRDRNA2_26618_c0_seq2:26-490(-)